ncbi:hypothetical protein [Plantactinospora sp. CA-290183]|uniref:hypothetical protein n=1 Tax=Plantactinospora sp. CA-290183 TaxID=3240006 RepID=UPI003D94D3F8
MNQADIDGLTRTAVTAIQTLFNTRDSEPSVYWTAERTAAEAVTAAILAGVHHLQLALLSGRAGLTIIELIRDQDAATCALRAERHHARRYLRTVQDETALHVIRALGPTGELADTGLAAKLDIPDTTLLWWMRRVQASDDAGENPQVPTVATDAAACQPRVADG